MSVMYDFEFNFFFFFTPQDLENINMLTMRGGDVKKRHFSDEHNNGPSPKQKTPSPPVIAKRLQGLLEERMEHNTDK